MDPRNTHNSVFYFYIQYGVLGIQYNGILYCLSGRDYIVPLSAIAMYLL